MLSPFNVKQPTSVFIGNISQFLRGQLDAESALLQLGLKTEGYESRT